MKYRLTVLLLAYTLLLGFIQAANQPFRLPEVCTQRMTEGACGDGCQQTRPKSECMAVCLVWCSVNSFNAVTEPAFEFPDMGVSPEFVLAGNVLGPSRTSRPLLPPPKR